MTEPTSADKLLASVRALIRAVFPRLSFLGVYAYTVSAASGATVDGTPADTTLGLPPITGLPLSPSILGEVVAGAAVGCTALVQFVNGDPTRPEVVSLSLPSSSSTVDATGTLFLGPGAQQVQLAGGTAPVARVGDAVTVYLDPTPIPVTGTIDGVTPFTGTITFAAPAMGIIVGGRPEVKA